MAAYDPFEQPGGRPEQPGMPQAQPPTGATPLGAAQSVPQARPIAQPQPTQPGHRPLGTGPAGQPIGQAASVARPVAMEKPSSSLAIRTEVEGSEETDDVAEKAIQKSPPWLISAAFHMIVLIILGLLVVAMQPREQIRLDIETVYAEELGEQLEFDSPLGLDKIEMAEEPVLTPEDLPEVDDPFAAPTMLEIQPDGHTATSDIQANQIGLALSGREEGSKRSLLGRYGGNALTEAAVQRGLNWLAKNQRRDGSWSLAGPYTDGVPVDLDNPPAATAMALLAFQGAGNTHRKGKFKRNVLLGWRWLLKEQDSDGNFYHEGPRNHRYYTQGQCAIAVCELYGMTKDPMYKKPAELAVQNCLSAQSPEGGWRYDPGADSDISVTGWIVMALQSARMAGLDVPEDHFHRITRFLDKVGRNGGSRYPYQSGQEFKLAMTAEAILMRQYLGWKRDNPAMIDALEWITSSGNLVNFDRGRDVYYWYYATQAAHHMEGDYWKRWNGVMRQVLPEQQQKRGREIGSWDPQRPTMDQWAPHGGRLYVTALSIYMLEVYYRHLPIYANVYTDLRKSGRTDGR